MLATAVVVFREVLDASLLVGIVAAATRSVPGRNRWLAAGTTAGLAGSAVVALFTGRIADFASGIGQEILNAAILGVAVVMLAWHNIWMASHGQALAANAPRRLSATPRLFFGTRSTAADRTFRMQGRA
jgi:high-affinity iron transporter